MGRWICSKGLQSLVFSPPPSFLPTLDFRVRSLLLCMSCNGDFFSLSGLLSLQSVCVVEPNYTLISRPPSFICILWLIVEGGIRADESEGVRVLTDSHKLMHLRSQMICKHSSWWMTVPKRFWRTSPTLCFVMVSVMNTGLLFSGCLGFAILAGTGVFVCIGICVKSQTRLLNLVIAEAVHTTAPTVCSFWLPVGILKIHLSQAILRYFYSTDQFLSMLRLCHSWFPCIGIHSHVGGAALSEALSAFSKTG